MNQPGHNTNAAKNQNIQLADNVSQTKSPYKWKTIGTFCLAILENDYPEKHRLKHGIIFFLPKLHEP